MFIEILLFIFILINIFGGVAITLAEKLPHEIIKTIWTLSELNKTGRIILEILFISILLPAIILVYMVVGIIFVCILICAAFKYLFRNKEKNLYCTNCKYHKVYGGVDFCALGKHEDKITWPITEHCWFWKEKNNV